MDKYAREARLKPALITVLPLAFLAVALIPSPPAWWGAAVGLFTASGVFVLAAQIARTAGRRKEVELYQGWGGRPTTARLSWLTPGTNRISLKRLHVAIERATGIRLPTEDEEKSDPQTAHLTYEAVADALRELTRDHARFDLLFQENCSYGYRRNLLGLRPLGMSISWVALSACLLMIGLTYLDVVDLDVLALSASIVVALIFIFIWLRLVRAEWVRDAGDIYAERLLASAFVL